MPESRITPLNLEEGLYRWERDTWLQAGTDDFTQPPAQNQDKFEQLLNVLPPAQNVLKRRFGYATFTPQLDTGISHLSDTVPTSALYGEIFNGTTGYIFTHSSVTFNYNPTLSIEFWFETASTSGGYFVSLNSGQQIAGGQTIYTAVYMDTAGKVGFGFYNGATVQLATVSSTAYNDGQGHHCVVTASGTSWKLYVDGVLVTTQTFTTGSGTPTAYWRLAEGPVGITDWPASISYMATFLSSVAIYSTALSLTQVQTHYNSIVVSGGTQAAYDTAVKVDSPTYFWYLNESIANLPPLTRNTINQTATTSFFNLSGTVALPLATQKGNVILVSVAQNQAGEPTITDSLGNTYIEICHVPNDGGYGLHVFYAYVVNPGNTVVTVTASHGYLQILTVQELQNIKSTSPVDAQAITQGNGTAVTSAAITTGSFPDLLLSIVYSLVPSTVTQAGYLASSINSRVNVGNGNLNNTLGIAYVQKNATGTFSVTWTQASAHLWIGATIGLILTLPDPAGAYTGLTIAFDYADSNNGYYANTSGVTLGTYIVV